MTLFNPIRVGSLELPNRIVMAPLGRARNEPASREALARSVTYYVQRASAGLIISEATHVSATTVSRLGTGAIHTDGQVAAWQAVTTAVHAAGGRIFQQLFHLGRKADPARTPGHWPFAPSVVAARGTVPTAEGPKPFPVPRTLTLDDIATVVEEFRKAIVNSRAAGFDGVEIHAANGFLIEQFLRDDANLRDDRYGGTAENRSRFLLEIVDAAIAIFGAGRVGVRVSPHFTVDGDGDSDPKTLFAVVAAALDARGIAYLHLIEPDTVASERRLGPALRTIFKGPIILADGFSRNTAHQAIDAERADLVAFGRLYISNPDLVERFRHPEGPLNAGDESTFHAGGDEGYIDYPSLDHATSIAAE